LEPALAGNSIAMLTILLIVLIVLLLVGGIGGPRWYRGRRTTVVRERDVI
jgi:flagellar basal body-associated protein FliL